MKIEETKPLAEVSEKALSMSRDKNVSLTTRVGYLLTNLGKKIVGEKAMLRFI